MREGKLRRISQREIVKNEPRCIYCDAPSETLDHMPSISMFFDRKRPKGFEFGSCKTCNGKTKSAESVASFLARIRSMQNVDDPLIQEALRKGHELSKNAPDFLSELKAARAVCPIVNGIVRLDLREITAQGPVMRAYLDVFGAKLAMALHREIMGEALSLTGHIFTTWYTDMTLSMSVLENFKRNMPAEKIMAQGKISTKGSFEVIYNYSLEKKTLISLSTFHGGFSVFTASSTEMEFINILKEWPRLTITKPKEYINLLPVRRSV